MSGNCHDNRSVESPVSKLEELCASDSLSLEGLRTITAQIPTEDERIRSSRFLHHACLNENVTLEIVEFLLEFHPGAAAILDESTEFSEIDEVVFCYPLHLACYNSRCPSSVLELLVKENPSALRVMDYIFEGIGLDQDHYFEGWAEGLPLHYYLSNRSHIDLHTVKLMVDEYPEALATTHREDMRRTWTSAEKISPLYALLMNKNVDNMYEIVQFFVGTGLPGLDLSDSYHRPPLDIACANENMNPKVVELLLNRWPESTRNDDENRGRWDSAISTLCETPRGGSENKHAEAILRLLVDADPEPVRWRGDDFFFPLHTAALHNHSPGFCKILIDAFPEAAKDNVSYGTPLANACIYHPNNRLDTVKYLFDVYPEAIEIVQNASGKTPLEIARCYQERGNEEDKQENGRVISFLEAQLVYVQKAADNEALSTQNSDGRLPLHEALVKNASLGSVKLLVGGNPAALHVADNRGTRPLHIACEFCTADIVHFLVEVGHSQSSWGQCDGNKNYPLHFACRGANYGVVRYLLEMRSPAVSERNGDDKLPIQLLCESMDENIDHQRLEYVEAIFLLLLAYPETGSF